MAWCYISVHPFLEQMMTFVRLVIQEKDWGKNKKTKTGELKLYLMIYGFNSPLRCGTKIFEL